MGALRRLSAAVAGVIAALLLPLGMLSSWVSGLATDTDRYVSTVGPLADDSVIQKATIRALETETFKLVDLGTRSPALVRYLRSHGFAALATSGGAITAAVRDEIEKTVRQVVRDAVESSSFRPVWETANRSAHRELVRILSDDEDAVIDRDGRVSVELGAVLNTAAAGLQKTGLIPPGELPEVKTSFALVSSTDLDKARRSYQTLEALGFWLPVLWVVAVVLAIVLSRRRARAVRLMLFGGVAGILALILGIEWLGRTLADRSPDAEVTSVVWEQVTDGLRLALLVVSLVAAAGFTWLSTLVPNRLGQPAGRTATLVARVSAGLLVAVAVAMVVTG